MIDLVLNHACMESVDRAVDRLLLWIDPGVAEPRVAGHHAAQPRHRQAPFPALLDGIAQRREDRVDEHGRRHGRRIGIALHALETEHNQPQRHTDLGRGQPGALRGAHRLEHIGDQFMQRGAEIRHRLADAQQTRITHAQDLADHGETPDAPASRTAYVSTSTARVIAPSITCSISFISIRTALLPRPAAWLTTTHSAA